MAKKIEITIGLTKQQRQAIFRANDLIASLNCNPKIKKEYKIKAELVEAMGSILDALNEEFDRIIRGEK